MAPRQPGRSARLAARLAARGGAPPEAPRLSSSRLRLGVDLGGTKIEIAVLGREGREVLRRRSPTPQSGYDAALQELAGLILRAEAEAGAPCSVGVGMPGSISPRSGRVFNAYNTPFNGRTLKADLERKLGRETRFANDANCFALSEACDGAAAGARVVFGAIFGTGVGGGIVVGRGLVEGANGIAGEWGHTPLPWMTRDEHPGPDCYCGRKGCIEQFASGAALTRMKQELGEEPALEAWEHRVARALSLIINFLDPDAIVMGGGASNVDRLYTTVPRILPAYVYAPSYETPLLKAKHGDSSGVRGAAMLWPE